MFCKVAGVIYAEFKSLKHFNFLIVIKTPQNLILDVS